MTFKTLLIAGFFAAPVASFAQEHKATVEDLAYSVAAIRVWGAKCEGGIDDHALDAWARTTRGMQFGRDSDVTVRYASTLANNESALKEFYLDSSVEEKEEFCRAAGAVVPPDLRRLIAVPAMAAAEDGLSRDEAAMLHTETAVFSRACGFDLDYDALQAWGDGIRPGDHDAAYAKQMARSFDAQDARLAQMSPVERADICAVVGRRVENEGLLVDQTSLAETDRKAKAFAEAAVAADLCGLFIDLNGVENWLFGEIEFGHVRRFEKTYNAHLDEALISLQASSDPELNAACAASESYFEAAGLL